MFWRLQDKLKFKIFLRCEPWWLLFSFFNILLFFFYLFLLFLCFFFCSTNFLEYQGTFVWANIWCFKQTFGQFIKEAKLSLITFYCISFSFAKMYLFILNIFKIFLFRKKKTFSKLEKVGVGSGESNWKFCGKSSQIHLIFIKNDLKIAPPPF